MLRKIALAMCLIGIINAMACLAGAAILGGAADPMKPGETRYYEASHAHRMEVTALAWHYSSIHGSTLVITHPMALLGRLVLVWPRRVLSETK